MSTWTESDIQWLIENYPSRGKRYSMKYLNKTEAQIRQKASNLKLRQDRNSEFFKDWQNRAASSKVGKKRPDQAIRLKEWMNSGTFVRHDSTTHGMSRHPAYQVWRGMIYRCDDANCPSYKDYGGRGITVCDEWRDVKSFVDWYEANPRPKNTTIDRIDVNGNYEPSNCRWATAKVQSRNKRNNTLSPEIVEKIREMVKETGNQREVGRLLGINYKNINMVMRGKTWVDD